MAVIEDSKLHVNYNERDAVRGKAATQTTMGNLSSLRSLTADISESKLRRAYIIHL